MTAITAKRSDQSDRSLFQCSIETKWLIDRGRRLQVGEVVTYEELSKLIGIDVREEGRGALRSARNILLRDEQIVLDSVPNVGLKRSSDSEIVQSAGAVFSKLRRGAQRGVQRLTAVADFDRLSDADKLAHNASVSALAVIKLMGKPKSVERIAASVNTANTGSLPIARTLELFHGPRPVKSG
jgi:hypothetical protein